SLWVAIKHEPLYLQRDPQTHVQKYSLRQWWTPAFLHHSYACHVEIVLCGSCTGPHRCEVCPTLDAPAKSNTRVGKGRHYITFSVDRARKCVFRTSDRHIVPPRCHGPDESWSYYRMAMEHKNVLQAN